MDSRGIRVLIVEDERSMQAIMDRIIKDIDKSAQPTWVTDVWGAVASLKKHDYDLILADYWLEGSSTGLTLWNFCRERYPDTPFIMMSSMSVDEYLKLTQQFSRKPYFLPKPFLASECREYLRWHLNHKEGEYGSRN